MFRKFMNYIWKFRIALFLITFFFIIAADGDFGSLEEVFVWIVTGGGAMVLAGLVVAYLLENWSAWHNFPRWVKVLVPIALSCLFGFLAQSVLALDLLPKIPPIIQAVLLMMINWLFSQFGYKSIKEGSYGNSARS